MLARSASRNPSLQTQTRPAIEFVSGEEGLRPKSYFLIYTCLEYTFTDALKYVNTPGSFCGAEGKGGFDQLCLFSRTGVVSLILLVYNVVPQKMSFNKLPSRAAALAAGSPRGQLRTPYAAGWWLDFVESEHEEPSEGIGVSFLGFCLVWFLLFFAFVCVLPQSRVFHVLVFFVHLRLFSAWFFCARQASVSVRAVLFVIVTSEFDVFCFLITLALSLQRAQENIPRSMWSRPPWLRCFQCSLAVPTTKWR